MHDHHPRVRLEHARPPNAEASSAEAIAATIRLVRGVRVMLVADLARLYGVSTKRLNEQVRRNRKRFPVDFMFRITPHEMADLRSQIATSSAGHGGRRHLPFAFTEHGAIMLAAVLDTPVAVRASIEVIRAFVRLPALVASVQGLAEKLDVLERCFLIPRCLNTNEPGLVAPARCCAAEDGAAETSHVCRV